MGEVEKDRITVGGVEYVRLEILLQFVASLTLGDHMGDVANDVDAVLRKLGVDVEWESLDQLGSALGERGVTTLHGTSMKDDPADAEDDDDG